MNSLNSFMSNEVLSYLDLFKVKHSDSRSLLLFQDYLCYRALLDVLSLRTSRWEELVKLHFPQVKSIVCRECSEWLHLVHLGVLVRDAILHPSQTKYSDVLNCIKANSSLFPSQQLHMKLVNELNLSIACNFLSEERDKAKVIEVCDMSKEVLGLISAFPNLSESQDTLMAGRSPHSALVKVLDQLRRIVMKMKSPTLVKLFDEGGDDVEAEEISVDMKESSKEVVPFDIEQVGEDPPMLHLSSGTDDSDDTDEPKKDSSPLATERYFLRAKSTDKEDAHEGSSGATGSHGTSPRKRSRPSHGTSPRKRSRPLAKQEGSVDMTSGGSNNESEEDYVVDRKTTSDISEDDDDYKKHGKMSRHKKRKVVPGLYLYRGTRHRWTRDEVKNLLKGVKLYGVGNWAKILKEYNFLPTRDGCSLKDKWRNMLKSDEVSEEYTTH